MDLLLGQNKDLKFLEGVSFGKYRVLKEQFYSDRLLACAGA